jgi:hypothetical protein
MLSKFAKEEKDIKTKTNQPISVSPTTGYSSWFTIWNTKEGKEKEEKEEKEEKGEEEDNKSDTSEIFKLSEDETSKLPVDIEASDNENENKDTETDNSDYDSSNSDVITTYDKYLGSKKCMINDYELPYNYSLLYEDINRTKSICQKMVNNNIQMWNNASDAFKIYAIAIGSIYLGIAEPVAISMITYCFMSKFTEDIQKREIEKFSPIRFEPSNDAETADNEESSDCAADSEQD